MVSMMDPRIDRTYLNPSRRSLPMKRKECFLGIRLVMEDLFKNRKRFLGTIGFDGERIIE